MGVRTVSATRTLRYVIHSEVERYQAQGWHVIVPGLRGTHHGRYSELMEKGSNADSDTVHAPAATGRPAPGSGQA